MAQPSRSNLNSPSIKNVGPVQDPQGLPKLPDLPVTALHAQYSRQHISPHWRPNGYERFPLMNYWQDSMPTIEGDGAGYNPDRFKPATSCQDTLDCHCGE